MYVFTESLVEFDSLLHRIGKVTARTYLTIDKVLAQRSILIKRYGRLNGILDMGALQGVMFRP